MRALQTALDSGAIRLVADGQHWAVNWDPRDALKKTEQVLTQTNNRVDAVVRLQRWDGWGCYPST